MTFSTLFLNFNAITAQTEGCFPQFQVTLGQEAPNLCKGKFKIPVYLEFNQDVNIVDIDFKIDIQVNPVAAPFADIDEALTQTSIYPTIRNAPWFSQSVYDKQSTNPEAHITFQRLSEDQTDPALYPNAANSGVFCWLHVDSDDPFILEVPKCTITVKLESPCTTSYVDIVPYNIRKLQQTYNPYGGTSPISGKVERLPLDGCSNTSGRIPFTTMIYNTSGTITNDKTSLDGTYCHPAFDGDYVEVSAHKGNVDYLCGITTADILKIQKHILGVAPFTENWQMICADVNQNGFVTAADISSLRKLILGIEGENYFNSTQRVWEFYNAEAYNNTPFTGDVPTITEKYNVAVSSKPITGKDFYGIKIGDLNGSCDDCSLGFKNGDATTRSINDPIVSNGPCSIAANQDILIPIYLNSTSSMMALEMYFNTSTVQILGIVPVQFSINDCDYIAQFNTLGLIANFMDVQGKTFASNLPAFYIKVSQCDELFLTSSNFYYSDQTASFSNSLSQITIEASHDKNKINVTSSNDMLLFSVSEPVEKSAIIICDLFGRTKKVKPKFHENKIELQTNLLHRGYNIIQVLYNNKSENVKYIREK